MSEVSSVAGGWSLADPSAALASFLSALSTPLHLLALGEPNHSLELFPEWRNRLLRVLVEEHGFRSVALESDIVAGMQVGAYVLGGPGTLDEVMRDGFSHGFGARPANRELVAWLRAFNAGQGPGDQVRFYGFDPPVENLWAASPRASLLALHAFLGRHLPEVAVDRAGLDALCGDEARWTNPAAGMDAAQSVGASEEARHLRALAGALADQLRLETPRLAAAPDWWEAQLHARTAVGLLQYHAQLADPHPERVERMLARRDLLMADHLCAIAGREQERGPTLVFAHNVHLQRPQATLQMGGMPLAWWGAGAHVAARLGPRYAFIASERGTEVAGRLYAAAHLKAAGLPPRVSTQVPGDLPLDAGALAQADGLLWVGLEE